MVIAKKHRINSLFRKGADHLEDLCGYIQRNDFKNTQKTADKLQNAILQLMQINKEAVIQSLNIITHTYGHLNVVVCNWCQEEPASYKDEKFPDYPHLCKGCKEYADDFTETTGIDRKSYRLNPALKKVADGF